MPKYMLVGSYTSDSWARMVENPQDRSVAARTAVEAVGGTLETFYWAFGPDDWVAIADLPDAASAGAVSIGVSSAGAVHSVRTVRLITMAESQAMLQKAQSVAKEYRVPSA